MKYTVGIIGLGNIGMTYDSDVNDTTTFLSHSKSFYHHPAFELSFLLDIKEDLRIEAKKRFPEISVISAIEEVKVFPDVLVLAASPEVNLKYLQALKDKKEIKLFVVEKPFWSSAVPEEWLEEVPSQKIYVNYFRKYLPYFQNLKKQISVNHFGKPLSANVYYSKGLRNNGSHVIDLLHYLFAAHEIESGAVFQKVNDYKEEDLSLSFVLRFKNAESSFPVVFNALDERNYSLIELDLFFEKQRIRLHEFGGKADTFSVKEDPLFPGYLNLLPEKEKETTAIDRYAYYLCDKVKMILAGEAGNDSSLRNEKYIFDTIQQIKNKL